MIHFITMALGGEGYLNFMGNEVSTQAHSESLGPLNCQTWISSCIINMDHVTNILNSSTSTIF